MRTFIVFLLLSVGASVCSAQWVQTNGPVRGPATCFAVSGMNLFAGTSGRGVFLSTDDGTSWTSVNAGLTHDEVSALAVSGTDLFAGTWGGGVFCSTDSGMSWITANSGLTDTTGVNCLAVNGTDLFAGTGSGVFLSTNNGTSWTSVNAGLAPHGVSALAVSGTNLFAGTGSGVFLSTNDGGNWIAVNAGLMYTDVRALAVCGTNLFAGTYGGGVFLSTNNGTSWTETNNGLPGSRLYEFAVCGTNLFAGSWGSGVFLSTDNGATWTGINSGLIGKDVSSVCAFGTNLLAGTGCGVFRSTDIGSSWSFVHDLGGSAGSAGSGFVGALAVKGGEVFAGTQVGGTCRVLSYPYLFHSTDFGESWVPEMPPGANAIVMQSTDVFVGGGEGVFLSTNDGTTWTAINNGLTNTWVCALAFSPKGANRRLPTSLSTRRVVDDSSSGANLFAGTGGGGIFLSSDRGTSWSGVNVGLSDMFVRALAVSGTNLFAGTDTGGVFLSTDNGTSWTAVNAGLTINRVSALAVSGTDIFAGTYGGVFLSTDSGTNWTPVNTGLTSTSVLSLAVSGTSLFAGTWDGVFLSTNKGVHWTSVNEGLPRELGDTTRYAQVYTLAVTENYVFAAPGSDMMECGVFGHGLWERPLSEFVTSVQRLAGRVPCAFEVSQNYPNPFNPSTTIRYGLPRSSFVTLAVYNTLGQQVAQLVNEQQQAGYHHVVFRGYGLASGVYFYRLDAGQFTIVKKLILLK